VRLKGVFFKLWAYQSDFIKKYSPDMRQPSPLVMGHAPEVIPQDVEWSQWGSSVIMTLIVVGVGAVWFVTWRLARGDKQFDRKVLRKFERGDQLPSNFQMPQAKPTPPDEPQQNS
jgi:hypothetical protein